MAARLPAHKYPNLHTPKRNTTTHIDVDGYNDTNKPYDNTYNNVLIPLAPLSNPLISHRFFTNLYDTFDKLLNDVHKFIADTGFNMVKVRFSNNLLGFNITYHIFCCQ
jgi:hypothetical protein